jgi:hypothetical protein
MKIITRLTLITAAPVLAALLAPALQATEITGSIGFGSLGVDLNEPDLATASSFTLDSPFISTETGVYSGIAPLTPITFNGFEFNPPVASVTPLWTFDVGSTVYSFDATSVSSYYNDATRQWDIGGSGIAMITGYTATPGTWNLNLSQSGASIVFDSTSAESPSQSAPDNGSTLMLLGGGFIGLAGTARKLKI